MGTHVRERESCIREFVMVEQASLRRRTESAIDALLALLDELDSDPDLEPDNDDEPALGWPQDGPQSLCQDPGDDREGASWPDDMNQCRLSPWRGMASEDDEPSLGSTEKGMAFFCFSPMQTAAWGNLGHKGPSGDEPRRDGGGSQLRWAEGARDDAEGDEHDGCEPEHDEPSLAAGEEADQTHWGEGRMMGVDLEGEHDGREPDEDLEPDLGSTDRYMVYAHFWDARSLYSSFLGHKGPSGEEPTRDDSGSQLRWADGAGQDAEDDPAEWGIADADGAHWFWLERGSGLLWEQAARLG